MSHYEGFVAVKGHCPRVMSNLNSGALIASSQLFARGDGLRDFDAASF
jgi:hypothetical protein